MLSYFHNIRPSGRRSAVATATSGIPNGALRQYHEPSVSTRENNSLAFYPKKDSPSKSSLSPISSDPPVIPPISLVASPHGSTLSQGTGNLSPRQTVTQTQGEPPYQDGPLDKASELARGDSFTTPSAIQDYYEADRNKPGQSPSLLLAMSEPLEDRKPHSQGVSSPQSKGNWSSIPQPDRPPPMPPVYSPKPGKPSSTGDSQTRYGKTKRNLLNPMAILARRRSSQPASQAVSDKHSQIKGSDKSVIGLSDDYDPRIRGNIVHDFSAPQTERTSNALARGKGQAWNSMGKSPLKLSPESNSSPPTADESPHSAERQHTPVFKEHFDDDFQIDHRSSVERECIKPSPFIYQINLNESYSSSDPDPSSLPPFARNLASKLSKATEAAAPNVVSTGSLEVVPEMSFSDEALPSLPLKTSSPVSPPKVRSRASSNADSPFQPGGLPKRFKSNSSRFSFDMAGVGSSAQEKILEERHRQKAKDKARASDVSMESQRDNDSNEEEYGETYSDYSSIDDGAGFEESVPGINADANEDLVAVFRQDIHNIQPLSPVRPRPGGLVSPENSSVAHINASSGSPGQPAYPATVDLWPGPLKQARADDPLDYPKLASVPDQGSGLGIAMCSNDHSHPLPPDYQQEETSIPALVGIPRENQYPDDDDLYFDDGMIEDVEMRHGEVFDESVFDDDTSRIYGLPLRDLKLSHDDGKKSELSPDPAGLESHDSSYIIKSNLSKMDASNSEATPSLPRSEPSYSIDGSTSENRSSFCQGSDFKHDNLAAYHDALAFAANQAAMKGEFTRSDSIAEEKPEELSDKGSPGHGTRTREVSGLSTKFDFQDPDDFDYDDALTDDPIIAAANAEALENDDEGFYGQEFGFFARATGPGEYANGGYFGPPGVDGIGRSHSGRINFQEPSLTPITERSEWSNRNSAISLALHGFSQSAQQNRSSPGLAQLADMISLEEDDLSLSALMKLRREAWGGSTTSLPSSPSSGSQLNLLPAVAINPTLTPNLRLSTHSLVSSNSFNSSDSDASPSSPTITLPAHQMPQRTAPSPSEPPTNQIITLHNPSESSLASNGPPSSYLVDQKKGHHRKSSGADSVSYVHEEDESGTGGRWVVEKRRVSEGGKIEVLDREIVEGGRI